MSETPATITLSELQEHLRSPPFHQLFDLTCVRFDRDAGELEILMRYTPSVERSAGTRQYHGGAIGSLIDIAGDYALWAVLGYGVPTINLRIDFLRPAGSTESSPSACLPVWLCLFSATGGAGVLLAACPCRY